MNKKAATPSSWYITMHEQDGKTYCPRPRSVNQSTGSFPEKPTWNVNNGNAFVIAVFIPGPGKQHLRIRITNPQKWFDFAVEGGLVSNAVADLDVYFLTAFHGNKINLFLIKFSYIYFISPS